MAHNARLPSLLAPELRCVQAIMKTLTEIRVELRLIAEQR